MSYKSRRKDNSTVLKDFVALTITLIGINFCGGCSYEDEYSNPPAQDSSPSANNGNRFPSTSSSVMGDEPKLLVTAIKSDTIIVVDSSTTLNGMMMTAQTGDLSALDLAKLPVSDAPEIPAWINPLTDLLVVRNSFESNLELRFPIPSLPPNVSLSNVDLYAYTGAEDVVEKFWSPVSIQIDFEGKLDSPVIVIQLGGLEGRSFLGYSTPQSQSSIIPSIPN